ncbi:MAG: hypothetical protein R3B95_17735 [Nitrospirales bacterium]|nr:hypothetical protein [Nitrospirales bacterium]
MATALFKKYFASMWMPILIAIGPTYILLFSANSTTFAFDYFEHKFIGDSSWDSALGQVNDSELQIILKSLRLLRIGEEPCDFRDILELSENGGDFESNSELIENCNLLMGVPLTFGDLTALAGDHHEVPDLESHTISDQAGDSKINETIDSFRNLILDFNNPFFSDQYNRVLATRRQWIRACAWFTRQGFPHAQWRIPNQELAQGDLQEIENSLAINGDPYNSLTKDCFKDLLPSSKESFVPTIPEIKSIQLGYRAKFLGYKPTRNELSEFEILEGYRDLAQKNKQHFPTHSWKTYIVLHFYALEKARKFFKNNQKNLTLFLEAIILESFAQHFLHDSFASGHIGSPYGDCMSNNTLPIFCNPTKPLLEHTHSQLNKLGMYVKSLTPQSFLSEKSLVEGEINEKIWYALGDRHLFIPEAAVQRSILYFWATHSILEIFDNAHRKTRFNSDYSLCTADRFQLIYGKWLQIFPIPAITSYRESRKLKEEYRAKPPKKYEDLVSFKPAYNNPKCFLAIEILCSRSSDFRVEELNLEGWKLLATWGPVWGKLDELNIDGTTRKKGNFNDGGSFEIGYIRPTDFLINYFGAGSYVLPGTRVSLYPLSIGSWYSPPSQQLFLGSRVNFGVRILEAFQENNPTNQVRSRAEISLPFDFGISIYPPISLYIRAEVFTVVFKNENASHEIESIFRGRGSISFGFSWDLAGIGEN